MFKIKFSKSTKFFTMKNLKKEKGKTPQKLNFR